MTRKKSLVFYFSSFAALCVIFALIPLLGDDMTFSALAEDMSIADMFKYSLGYGNGRLLGNMTILFIMKSTTYFSLFKALVLTCIAYLISKICELKTLAGHALTALFVFFPSANFFSHVYAWSAGFTNYVVPILFTLLCVCIIKQNFRKDISAATALYAVLLLVLGASSQLYSENTTVFNFILAAFVVFVSARKSGKLVRPLPVAYLLSTVIGAVIMFLVPRLSETTNDLSWYRSTSLDGTLKTVTTAYDHYYTICLRVFHVIPLWIVLSVCLIIAAKRAMDAKPTKKLVRNLIFGLLSVFPMFSLFLMTLYDINNNGSALVYLLITLLLTFYLIAAFVVIIKYLPKQMRPSATSLFVLTVAALAPLLFVSPIGVRTIYLGYIIMIFLTMYLFKNICVPLCKPKVKNFVGKVAGVILVASFVCVFATYVDVYDRNSIRIEYIESEVENGSRIIYIPPLPHDSMLFDENKQYKTEGLSALYYIEKPGDIKFIVAQNYSEWYNDYYLKAQKKNSEKAEENAAGAEKDDANVAVKENK